jgi:hypothetical protein
MGETDWTVWIDSMANANLHGNIDNWLPKAEDTNSMQTVLLGCKQKNHSFSQGTWNIMVKTEN